MSFLVPFSGPARVTIPVGARIAVWSAAPYSVTFVTAPVDINGLESPLFSGSGSYTSAVYANGATVTISGGGDSPLYYSVGTAATVVELLGNVQADPGTLNATGTLTSALIQGGIVTSTTAAAVVATLDTGTIMDASGTFAINDCFDWSAINTGGANAFTVTASTGHTIVGSGVVALTSTGRFRTRKTAANTFVTYRL